MDKNLEIKKKLIHYCSNLSERCGEISYDEFSKNELLIEGCVFELSQIGELSTKLDEDFKNKYNIEWKSIKGLRNRIVHDYEGINLTLVWDIIKNDIPTLRQELEKSEQSGE